MKLFQKRWFAWIIAGLMVLTAVIIGQVKSRNITTAVPEAPVVFGQSSRFDKYIADNASLLSKKTEKQISAYNYDSDQKYGSIMAVVTVNGILSSDMETAAYNWAEKLALGENDLLLLFDADRNDWYCVYGDGLGYYADNMLEDLFFDNLSATTKKNLDKTILPLYAGLSRWYTGTTLQPSSSNFIFHPLSTGNTFLAFLILLIVLIIIISVIRLIFKALRSVSRSVFMPGIHVSHPWRSSYRNTTGYRPKTRSSTTSSSSFRGTNHGSIGKNAGTTKTNSGVNRGNFGGSRTGGFGSGRGGSKGGFGKH